MENWIYLKKTNTGFDDIKAIALASVLCTTSDIYNLVRTSMISKYMKGLENVRIGNPRIKDGDIVATLDLPDYAPFEILCEKIAVALSIKHFNSFSLYLGFARKTNEIDRQLSNKGELILLCYYMNERELFLISQLNEVVKKLNIKTCSFICCGSKRDALIKGSFDFRELIQIDEIIKNRERIKVIITASALVKEIGCQLGIPVVYLFSYAYVAYYKNIVVVESTLKNFVKKMVNTITDIHNNGIKHKKGIEDIQVIHKFEVPYSFDEEILPYYAHYSAIINFLFLPPFYEDSINTRTCLQSKIKGFTYMPQTREEYEYHLQLIKERNLKFVVLWQDREDIISRRFLDYYTKIGASGFIVANDENAKIIKTYNPNLIVTASIVQRLCKGMRKKGLENYDYCVLFYPFTRSLNALKLLSEFKNKLVIMPNSFCHTDCPGVQHWFVKDIKSFEFDKLCPAYNDDTKSTFIYPEHLYLFDDFVGGFKLQGREWSTDNIVTACEAYFHRFTPSTLVPPRLDEVLRKMQKESSLDDYYNNKTNEIIEII